MATVLREGPLQNADDEFPSPWAFPVQLTGALPRTGSALGGVIEPDGPLVGPGPARPAPAEPTAPAEPAELTVTLTIVSPEGRRVAELPIMMRRRVDDALVRLDGGDASGSLTVAFGVNLADRSGNVRLTWTGRPHTLPSTVLPALTLLRHLTPPNSIAIRYQGMELAPPRAVPADWAELVPARIVDLIEKLDFVQRATGTFFYLPESFSGPDAAALDRAKDLLLGRIVVGTWNRVTVGLELAAGSAPPDGYDGELAFLADAEERIAIGEHVISIGWAKRHLLSARVAGWSPDPDGLAGQLALVPAGNREFEMWLPAANHGYEPVPGISAEFRYLVDDFMTKNDEALGRLAR